MCKDNCIDVEILKKVRDCYFNEYIGLGLCYYAAISLNEIEEKEFINYLYNCFENRVYYYARNGKKTKRKFYIWKPRNIKIRNKWLEEHIKLNS